MGITTTPTTTTTATSMSTAISTSVMTVSTTSGMTTITATATTTTRQPWYRIIGKGKCLHGKIRWAGFLADVDACATECASDDRCTHFTFFNGRGSCALFSGDCTQRKNVKFGDTYKMLVAAAGREGDDQPERRRRLILV